MENYETKFLFISENKLIFKRWAGDTATHYIEYHNINQVNNDKLCYIERYKLYIQNRIKDVYLDSEEIKLDLNSYIELHQTYLDYKKWSNTNFPRIEPDQRYIFKREMSSYLVYLPTNNKWAGKGFKEVGRRTKSAINKNIQNEKQ